MSTEIYTRLVAAGAPELRSGWSYLVEPKIDPNYTPVTEFFFVSIVDSHGSELTSKIRSCATGIDEQSVEANLVYTCGDVFDQATRKSNSAASRSLWTGSHP